MPAQNTVPQAESATVVRSVRLRLWPARQAIAYQLAGQAETCRFVGNPCLARYQEAYAAYQAGQRDPAPDLSY